MANTSTLQVGFLVVGLAMACTVVVVVLWRRIDVQDTLRANSDLVTNVYPIIGLVYGVFLGFTIIITWGHFQDAEASVMEEVTRVSELWRDAEPFPDSVRERIQDRLYAYVTEVVDTDWPSMAAEERHSREANSAYERIWDAYYTFQPEASK